MLNDIQEIEVELEVAKKAIRLGQLVTSLEKNEEFIELFTEGYFKEEAARVVMLKADPTFSSDEKQAKLDKDILGISVLGEYLRAKKLLGLAMEDAMREKEDTKAELLQEAV